MLLRFLDVALVVVLTVPVVAIACAGLTGSPPAQRARRASGALAVGAAAALIVAAAALAGTSTSFAGFTVDSFSGLVLVLVLGMGAIVSGFAARSLHGEPYQARFAMLGAALVGSGALLALAGNLIVLGVAWVATSALTVAIIRTGPVAGTRARSVRARRAFIVGDVAFVAALVALVASSGSTALEDVTGASAPVLTIAGILIVLAAATRSASGPFVRWLPDSLGAPTPSSALLHAGVVNGGAIVMIRLSPAVAATDAAIVALVIGGLTCVFAEAVMLTRPDIKGRLAWSTIAQMSFTMVLSGLGLGVAAGLHLVAHGFYKGAMFLGSGAAVRGLVRRRSAPLTARALGVVVPLVGFVVPGLVLATVAAVGGIALTAQLAVPVVLAWIAAGVASTAWLRIAATPRQRLLALLTGGVGAGAFLALTALLDAALAPGLAATGALSPLWVIPVLVMLAVVALTRPFAATGPRFVRRTWTFASRSGLPTAATGSRLMRPIAWSPPPRPRPAIEPTVEPAFQPTPGV